MFKYLIEIFKHLIEIFKYFIEIYEYFSEISKYLVGMFKHLIDIFKYLAGIFKHLVEIYDYFVKMFKYFTEIISKERQKVLKKFRVSFINGLHRRVSLTVRQAKFRTRNFSNKSRNISFICLLLLRRICFQDSQHRYIGAANLEI